MIKIDTNLVEILFKDICIYCESKQLGSTSIPVIELTNIGTPLCDNCGAELALDTDCIINVDNIIKLLK